MRILIFTGDLQRFNIIHCAFSILFALAIETSVERKFQTAANQEPVTQTSGPNLDGNRTYLLEKKLLIINVIDIGKTRVIPASRFKGNEKKML